MAAKKYSLEEARELWRQEPDDNVIFKAATEDIEEYSPEIQAVIKEEAERRRRLNETVEEGYRKSGKQCARTIAEYKKKANIGIALAIITAVVLGFIAYRVGAPNKALDIIFVLPMFLFIYGLCCYAKGKGYHGAWGLLGLFTLIGLIILVCLPDRHKSIKQKPKDEQKE